jgi:hypothetical protein
VTGGPGPDGAAPGRAGRQAGTGPAGQDRPVAPARPLLAPEADGTRRHARRIAGGISCTRWPRAGPPRSAAARRS